MIENPKISVCIVTYNQEKYISECIQSVINQTTNIPFEIIIGNDASTDKTTQIVRSLAAKHPGKIRLIEHPINIGATANVRSVYSAARGDFIAHLDGDDLMHSNKLQTQYDALIKNNDCVACTHEVHLIDPHGRILKYHWKNVVEGKKFLIDLLNNMPFFAHSSKFFRRESFLQNLLSEELIDCTIHYNQIKQGPFYHISESLGSYRLMTGITSKNLKINNIIVRDVQKIYEDALQFAQQVEKNAINKAYAKALMEFAYQSAVLSNKDDFKKFIKKSVFIKKISVTQMAMRVLCVLPTFACFTAKIRSQFRPGGFAYKCLH